MPNRIKILYLFSLTTCTGVWSCPVTAGDRPLPSYSMTFTAVDDRRAVMFGGYNREIGTMNTVYIIDLITMVIINQDIIKMLINHFPPDLEFSQ